MWSVFKENLLVSIFGDEEGLYDRLANRRALRPVTGLSPGNGVGDVGPPASPRRGEGRLGTRRPPAPPFPRKEGGGRARVFFISDVGPGPRGGRQHWERAGLSVLPWAPVLD